jgi:hypothetical protein
MCAIYSDSDSDSDFIFEECFIPPVPFRPGQRARDLFQSIPVRDSSRVRVEILANYIQLEMLIKSEIRGWLP